MKSRVAEDRLQVLQIYKLLQHVRDGDKSRIETMVNMGVEQLINLTEPKQGTGVLHLASAANNTDMASFLLSLGAHPNIQDMRGRTPVMLAADLGHIDMVTLLAQSNADMSLVDSEGKGMLFYCMVPTKRHTRCMQVGLKGNADVNNVSRAGQPVFLLACEQAPECATMCLRMLESGADPNATNKATGRTALMEACRAGCMQLVRAILQRGGNPNALDKKHFNATHFAAMGGFFEVIQILSAYGADMGVMTLEGSTALHYAAYGGFTDCCRFLAQRGCNSKLKDKEGLLPRQIAKDNGHKAATKELKKAERVQGKYAKPGVTDPNPPWALTLHDWSFENETLLRNAFAEESGGADSVSGETFISVLQGHHAPAAVEELYTILTAHDKKREGLISVNEFLKGLKYLQKPFVMTSYGPKKKKAGKGGGKKGKKKGKIIIPLPICTVPSELIHRREDGGPPHFMIETHHLATDLSRFDRDHPPSHPIEDDSAWYMDEPDKAYINISYSVKTGDLESLDLAFREGVPVDVKDRFYKTPLMTACSSGNYDVAHYLLSLGADVNACDQFRWTPLHHACHAGQLDVVELLLERGALVDAPALNGATPLMRAIESCRPCCVDFLIKAGANVTAENKKEQNCLDIARAYADIRIVDLIKAKIDSLPKPKDNKKAKPAKPQQKPKPVAATEKSANTLNSAPSQKLAKKDASQKETVVMHSAQITAGKLGKVDISFLPKTVRGNQLTSSQMLEKKERRRERFSYEVDFEDFLMPFSMNIQKKSLELSEVTN